MPPKVSDCQVNLAPIAVFAFNRPWHLQQTINSLLKNIESSQSDLFIFSDGPKDLKTLEAVNEVRDYIKSITGFKSINVIERKHNLGLGKSIIDGVTLICNRYKRVIVLEDDLVTAPFFLKFMNDALDYYESYDQVASIHGYALPLTQELAPTFFVRGADCLGWATWKDAWDVFEEDGQKLYDELHRSNLTFQFDLDGAYPFTQMLYDQIQGKNNSWAIRWHASVFLKNKLTLCTNRSLVKHIGNDGTGTNFGVCDLLDSELSNCPVKLENIPIVEDSLARFATASYFASYNSFFSKFLRKIKFIILNLKRNFS